MDRKRDLLVVVSPNSFVIVFFYNFFFLLISVSQFFPPLKVGYLFTYVSPLVFVLLISMSKEAFDDI